MILGRIRSKSVSFSQENDACLKEMEKILKADIRPSAEIIKDIQKWPKNTASSGQDPDRDRIIRK